MTDLTKDEFDAVLDTIREELTDIERYQDETGDEVPIAATLRSALPKLEATQAARWSVPAMSEATSMSRSEAQQIAAWVRSNSRFDEMSAEDIAAAMSTLGLPHLERFLGSYFHQDWASDTRSLTSAAADYAARVGGEGLGEVRAELTALLARYDDEAAILSFLDAAGVEIDVVRTAGTARAWLEQLALVLGSSGGGAGSGSGLGNGAGRGRGGDRRGDAEDMAVVRQSSNEGASMSVSKKAVELARRLNRGEEATDRLLADIGFDPDGSGEGDPVFPESPSLEWHECDLIDCGWENGASLTVQKLDDRWQALSRHEIRPRDLKGKVELAIVFDYDQGYVEFPGLGALEVAVIWREARREMLREYRMEPDEFLHDATEMMAPRATEPQIRDAVERARARTNAESREVLG